MMGLKYIISVCAYSAKICIGKPVQPSWMILLFFQSLHNTYNNISAVVIQGSKLYFMTASKLNFSHLVWLKTLCHNMGKLAKKYDLF